MNKYNDEYPMRNNPGEDYRYSDSYMRYSRDDMQMPTEDDYDEDRYESDREYMLSLYPDSSKLIHALVDKECDKLEQEDSIMYEEYPSKEDIEKIVADIYAMVVKELSIPVETQEIEPEKKSEEKSEETAVETQQYYYPDRNWLRDNVHVIFLNELFRRRRRRFPRRRRSFYPYYRPRRYLPYQPYVPYYYRY